MSISQKIPERLLKSNEDITITLNWQFVENPIDLDVSLVIYDKYGGELKALYFNERHVFDNLFTHSGDNRDGLQRDTSNPNARKKELETIGINLSKLSNLADNNVDDGILDTIHAIFIVVNVHESELEGSFKDVESGKITIYSGDKPLFQRGLDCAKYNRNEKYSSLLLGAIYKANDEAVVESYHTEWKLAIFEKLGFGHTFNEDGLIDDDILMHVYHEDEGLLEFRPHQRDKKYNLDKGQRYIFHSTLQKINVGLSWDGADDNKESIDMDCSVILLDKENVELTNVNKDNQIYNWNSKNVVKHLGDNKTGISSNELGDDETIKINLDACSATKCPVATFAAYINIASGAQSFKQIKNCKVRIYDPKNAQELCECQLSDFGDENGLIVYNITQIAKTGLWQLFTKTVPIHKGDNPVEVIIKDLGGFKGQQPDEDSDDEDMGRNNNNENPAQNTCAKCIIL